MKNNKKRIIIKVGDIYKIPLDIKKHAYAQYYHHQREYGTIVRIFNIITSRDVELSEIVKLDLMFPPIYIGLKPAIREGNWEKIGNVPICDFIMPKFRYAFRRKDGSLSPWRIIDGDKKVLIGDDLPEKYKQIEKIGIWSYHDVAKRIKNRGEIPYEAWK